MRIVNPTFGLSATTADKVALKSVNWKTDAIALVSNAKPNARELLDGIRAKLGAFRPVENIEFLASKAFNRKAVALVDDRIVGRIVRGRNNDFTHQPGAPQAIDDASQHCHSPQVEQDLSGQARASHSGLNDCGNFHRKSA